VSSNDDQVDHEAIEARRKELLEGIGKVHAPHDETDSPHPGVCLSYAPMDTEAPRRGLLERIKSWFRRD